MSMVLQSKAGDFKPHVEGIHPAVCVDLIDLGLVETEFQGQKRLVNKVRVVFETEQKNEEGKNCIITKTFTASLHPKAKLAEFLGKWRGRPVVPGESIDLAKLVGANCTLVISHQQNLVGRTYASIDAVSKPTKRLVASGGYDPAMARQRIAEWKAREGLQTTDHGTTGPVAGNQCSVISNRSAGVNNPSWVAQAQPERQAEAAVGDGRALNAVAAAFPVGTAPAAGPKRQAEPAPHKAPEPAFDPEVGF